jgi:TP901 family phage tail tape measure protein
MTFEDIAQLRIKVLDGDAVKSFETLNASAKDIKNRLREMEVNGQKNTEQYKALVRVQRDLSAEIAKTTKGVDLQNASMNELTALKRKLNQELNKLTIGSDAWINKLQELQGVNSRLSEVQEQLKSHQGLWQKYGDWIRGAFLAGGILELWQTLKGYTSGALEEAKNFEKSAQSLRGEVTLTTEQFENLKKSAIENGEQFGMTGEQMLAAYNAIASGKSDLIDIKGGIEEVTAASIMLAENGEMELAVAAKVMTESLNQYGAGAKDAAKFVDILSTGTQVGAGKIEEIGNALKYAGPMAKAAGVSFSETNAALQILHQNGIKGEQAGTALRGMLSRLLKGAAETNPSIVGMAKAIENLAKKQLDAKEMTKLFGQEAVSAGIAVVSNSEQLKEWTRTIEKGGGAASMYAEKTKTVEFAEKQAAAAYANSRKEIGDKLLPIWLELTNFFKDYAVPSIQAVATTVIAVGTALVSLPKFIIENKELFIALGVAIISLNTANIAAAASAIALAAAETTRAVVTKASATAQWLLNAAMTANPIGLVIAALATLTGGIIWAYKNVDGFRASIQATWAGLKEFIKIIWDVNLAFLKLDFSAAWDRIKNGWSSIGKASGEAYAKGIAQSNKKVAEDTLKNTKETGKKVLTEKEKAAIEEAKVKEKAAAGERIAKQQAQTKERLDYEAYKEEIQKIAKETDDKIKNLDEEYTKWLFEEYQKRSKEIIKSTNIVEKNIEKLQASRIESTAELEKKAANLTKQVSKDINDFHKKNVDKMTDDALAADSKIIKAAEEKAAKLKALQESFVREAQRLGNDLMDSLIAGYQKQVDAATNLNDKFMAEQKVKQAENTKDITNSMVAIMSGDFVTGAMGLVTGLVKYFDNEVHAFERALEARQKEMVAAYERNIQGLLPKLSATIDGLASINTLLSESAVNPFENVADSLEKLNDIYKTLSDQHLIGLDEMDIRAKSNSLSMINNEIQLGNQIIANYNLAVEKENQLFETKKNNIETLYQEAVSKINAEYALKDTLAKQNFSADSLAIQENLNAGLLALLTNEDSKTSIIAEHANRRSHILEEYALADTAITETTTQAEINAINEAKEARSKALSELEAWYTTELDYTVNAEGQKRKQISETQQLIKDAADAKRALDIEYDAEQIERSMQKNIQLQNLEVEKNAADLLLKTEHANNLVSLEDAKNAAIAASFARLKTEMIQAIEAMTAQYEYMVSKGVAGSNELLAKLSELRDAYRTIYNENATPTTNRGGSNENEANTPPPTNRPRFALGTEYVDPQNLYPAGIDTVPALVSKGERIIPSDLNAMLGGISNKALVAKLKSSNLYRNGSSISTTAGLVNLASPASINNINNNNTNISTHILEKTMAEMNNKMQAQINLLVAIEQKRTGINFNELKEAIAQDAEVSRRSSF